MLLWSIAFIGGVIVLYSTGLLLAPIVSLCVIFLALAGMFFKWGRVLACFFLGVWYASFRADGQLGNEIPDRLVGEISWITGYPCSGIAELEGWRTLDLCDVRIQFEGQGANITKIRVTEYLTPAFKSSPSPYLNGYIRAKAKLKPPRGLVNSYGFMAETWMFSNGYGGVASLKEVEVESAIPCTFFCNYWRYRNEISEKLSLILKLKGEAESAQLLASLVLGDKYAASPELKSLFVDTGTAHLLVVSGLHVSIVGGVIWWVFTSLVRYIRRRYVDLISPSLLVYLPVTISIVGVMVYVALVGCTIPATRAAIMFTITLIIWQGFHRPPLYGLCMAVLLLFLMNPALCLHSGFWLSVAAVGILIAFHSSRPVVGVRVVLWLKPHLILFLVFSPLLLWFGMVFSCYSLVANFVAVPLVSVVLLPLAMLATVSLQVSEFGFDLFFTLFAWFSELLFRYLELIAGLDGKITGGVQQGILPLICAMLLAGITCLPIPWRYRAIVGAVLSMFLFGSATMRDAARLHVLDVGQGLSLFFEAENHSLIYDFGSGGSETSGSGESVVYPNVRGAGFNEIELAIIGHWDKDHSGGWPSFNNLMKSNNLIASSVDAPDSYKGQWCSGGYSKRLGGLLVQVLWPLHQKSDSRNGGSCVVLLDYYGTRILITGDIDKKTERELVILYGAELMADILVVPHHGSRHSSSWLFLKTVKPKIALISSGFHNQFGHPHKDVLQRFEKLGISSYNTAESGELIVHLPDTDHPAPLRVEEVRKTLKRFWVH